MMSESRVRRHSPGLGEQLEGARLARSWRAALFLTAGVRDVMDRAELFSGPLHGMGFPILPLGRPLVRKLCRGELEFRTGTRKADGRKGWLQAGERQEGVWCAGALAGAGWPDILCALQTPPYRVDSPLCGGSVPSPSPTGCCVSNQELPPRAGHLLCPTALHTSSTTSTCRAQGRRSSRHLRLFLHLERKQSQASVSTVKFHEPLGQGGPAHAHPVLEPLTCLHEQLPLFNLLVKSRNH